jgi:hypothetical protein
MFRVISRRAADETEAHAALVAAFARRRAQNRAVEFDVTRAMRAEVATRRRGGGRDDNGGARRQPASSSSAPLSRWPAAPPLPSAFELVSI